jgi:hypothetical protein
LQQKSVIYLYQPLPYPKYRSTEKGVHGLAPRKRYDRAIK